MRARTRWLTVAASPPYPAGCASNNARAVIRPGRKGRWQTRPDRDHGRRLAAAGRAEQPALAEFKRQVESCREGR